MLYGHAVETCCPLVQQVCAHTPGLLSRSVHTFQVCSAVQQLQICSSTGLLISCQSTAAVSNNYHEDLLAAALSDHSTKGAPIARAIRSCIHFVKTAYVLPDCVADKKLSNFKLMPKTLSKQTLDAMSVKPN